MLSNLSLTKPTLLPVSLHRYEQPQPFTSLVSDFSVDLSVPDGDWSLVLAAPLGGVRGAISTFKTAVSRIGSVLGSSDTISLASFGGCVEESGGGEGNKTASCEDVSGSFTDMLSERPVASCVGDASVCLCAFFFV